MHRARADLVVLTVFLTILLGASRSHRPLRTGGRGAQRPQAASAGAVDPGVRGGPPAAGGPLPGLSPAQLDIFDDAGDDFAEVEDLADGLGPRFNLDSCGGCHAYPALGGSSPPVNPQFTVAQAFGTQNVLPSFLALDGPVREVRFQYKPGGERDGGVHSLFTIRGRVDDSGDARGCDIVQDDFDGQWGDGNATFRIPTPLFGAGLIEQIPDQAIVANHLSDFRRKQQLGIGGRPHRVRIDEGTTNLNGNDGTIARFGWKAQNKSLLLFAGEAYNVEMGISNELFQTERDETAGCQFASTPNDVTHLDAATLGEGISDIEKFALFMRFLAAPTPSPDQPGGADSIANGNALFGAIGCADCHTPMLRTGNSAVEALRDRPVPLYSDLLLHNMGPGLADDVAQAQAGPDEFRTAPLWGLGQRIHLLHDGRTSDLVEAIEAHRSAADSRFQASEANRVVDAFDRLGAADQQDLLNFLRSL
jgi:CxxC motif-containing protein (DUF1111 family)